MDFRALFACRSVDTEHNVTSLLSMTSKHINTIHSLQGFSSRVILSLSKGLHHHPLKIAPVLTRLPKLGKHICRNVVNIDVLA
jgi:hypothetical protein